mmetsp:Transcript_30923/g.47377  ORF Transcript_30923/g.47377 Transcript_30923/m.47377 type:complete len:320 (+) Transcript_30923:194-1153(+)|eukprot:CAMPEP_0195288784 /NCGR_PEP_ID=MMETSP0707-20130614/5308_1 /TAXON_ID=33640 /ORGANISM="Asterionellopsis glacialis, Strain CCMP134" /LENGTH=319 /DNA_ID=CAMNT_0040348689 /DNA_START=122 /DNA_END=1081 /DNA_ORIENTATION=+
MIALHDLPTAVLSNVLTDFCDGKSISTFLIVAQGSDELRPSSFEMGQGALVRRYKELAVCLERSHPNIAEILDVIREDIRTTDRQDPSFLRARFSKYCAILDYFEIQLSFTDSRHHWILWCGSIETQFGHIVSYVSSPDWSLESLQQWYRNLEMLNFSLVRPNLPDIEHEFEQVPFGTLAGLSHRDVALIKILRGTLEYEDFTRSASNAAIWQTPLQYAYQENPPLKFCAHAYASWALGNDVYPEHYHRPRWLKDEETLCCYWDSEEEECDWDDAVHNLGDNVIRIMRRFCENLTGDKNIRNVLSFQDALKVVGDEWGG